MAAALRLTDPALLHYRSGAFYLVRAAQAMPPRDGVADMLLGLMAAAAEPVAGGRHKVFGHPELHVIPQTSTIASHLPRSVGLAFAVARAAKLGLPAPWPEDCVVICSFGDASANHSTAAGAFNTASYCSYQGLPVPVLFVCEDNGLGISVRTPAGWTESAGRSRPRIEYFRADGSDLAQVYDAATAAASHVRDKRAPAFLHLRTVRLGGHAGTDVESAYRTPAEIAADTTRDPLLGTARLLVAAGALSPAQVLDRYEESRARVLALAGLAGQPRLSSAEQVMAPIAPRRPAIVAANLADRSRQSPDAARRLAFGGQLPEDEGPLTLAQAINRTLADELTARPGMLVFGEDVARKGGVYGVTRGLLKSFGPGRVFDSLLDEQSILGVALGAGLAGLLPVPEIQYLAYLHNAADQIRGEAATLSFFSRAQYRNPMVVRVPGLAYQQGFGGHFHNDNGLAALRDIPGLVIACPARPDDAAAMLRSCLTAAELDGERVRVPRAHRAVSRARPARAGRWRLAGQLRAAGPLAVRPCPARPRARVRLGHRPHDHFIRERGPDEPARRSLAGRPGGGQPRPGPALAGAAAVSGSAAGCRRDWPGADRRRDPPHRRRVRRRDHHSRRRRLHRPHRPCRQPGQLRAARRCG